MTLFAFNERITQGPNKPVYFYRGVHRNPYGVETHYIASSATSLKLERITSRSITKYHRCWRIAS